MLRINVAGALGALVITDTERKASTAPGRTSCIVDAHSCLP